MNGQRSTNRMCAFKSGPHPPPSPEKSLFWFAFNTGKRSITLNIETVNGREILRKLVRTADFLVESFSPGYLEKLDINYAALNRINPRLIMGSITPFGQTGPYAQWKGPDIVCWAMSGYMWMTGEPERAPLRVGCPPQVYLHAGAMATTGLLLALRYREITGEGQHVDLSAQQCPTWMLTNTYVYWDLLRMNLKRLGAWRHFGKVRIRTVYPCKDGYIAFVHVGGHIGSRMHRKVAELISEAGMADDWLKEFDWENWDAWAAPQEEVDAVSEAFGRFFKTKTRAELMGEAVKGEIMLAPVNTVADIMADSQLKARNFWVEVEHEELGRTITYPGAPCQLRETPWLIKGRAPLIGEYNSDIYERELGLSSQELITLRGAGVI